ncbi:cation efflux family protein family [Mucor ambiguus]|uniref:Cation efflux family protein family n=1 Tax=Mucor ambiguus TaxID=91626 RepID=A0A0C9M425_9FUNG|nr:cation efflux family protein family [Mucor ambiguus]
MHQTRQFTKRRPQSPLLNQQQTVDGLQVNKTALPRSGLAIQSNAPIHSTATSINRSFTPTTTTVEHAHHTHQEPNQHHHDTFAAASINPYVPHGDHKHAEESHHEHDHHGHDHHGHDHHGHDHHGHDHHGHDHNHNHPAHGHVHDHTHSHDHSHHHGHDHAHHQHSNFPQVYTQPLPSYASIFASLIPFQKALFTCFMGHFFIGIILWWLGVSRESLSITGFSYLVLFDAFGTLNNLASSVLHVNPAFTTMSTKRPFGVRRFEVVMALANTIFLLFGTMYTTKESLEHLLLEEHHGGGGDHHGNSGFPLGLLVMLLIAIGASFASSTKLKNHDNLVTLTKRSSQLQHEYTQNTPVDALVKNIYSLSIVSAGTIVFIFQLFGLSSPSVDKLLAFGEASLMLYLGAPTATALAKLLLQTMPDSMIHTIDHHLRSIQQIPTVVSVDKVHFWQNAYGKCIGTLEVHTRPDADEDAVINASFDILEPLVKENEGELTISIIKMK